MKQLLKDILELKEGTLSDTKDAVVYGNLDGCDVTTSDVEICVEKVSKSDAGFRIELTIPDVGIKQLSLDIFNQMSQIEQTIIDAYPQTVDGRDAADQHIARLYLAISDWFALFK